MGAINTTDKILHHIRVKLYPNVFNLSSEKGGYFARTANDSNLGVTEICTSMRDRGGFSGNLEEAIGHVRQFLNEMIWLLCDGFAVNTGYFSIHPKIGGFFKSPKDAHDPKKNPISLKYRTRKVLLELIKQIDVEVDSVADTNAYIEEFNDTEKDSSNSGFVPGNMFCITGSKIKIAGDHPDCGVYFVPLDDPSKAVKVSRIAENNPSRIIGICPYTDSSRNRIEIRTQFTGSTTIFLKNLRVITGNFILEAINAP
ncbi:MAG: DUF4469 domain-containing protein [Treponema sp.]|nr:DUF4469 domain-containing protein [Treponema sp.]